MYAPTPMNLCSRRFNHLVALTRHVIWGITTCGGCNKSLLGHTPTSWAVGEPPCTNATALVVCQTRSPNEVHHRALRAWVPGYRPVGKKNHQQPQIPQRPMPVCSATSSSSLNLRSRCSWWIIVRCAPQRNGDFTPKYSFWFQIPWCKVNTIHPSNSYGSHSVPVCRHWLSHWFGGSIRGHGSMYKCRLAQCSKVSSWTPCYIKPLAPKTLLSYATYIVFRWMSTIFLTLPQVHQTSKNARLSCHIASLATPMQPMHVICFLCRPVMTTSSEHRTAMKHWSDEWWFIRRPLRQMWHEKNNND